MELYVHFPFCRQKCRYCDFPSFPHLEDQMEAYGNALLREADLRQAEASDKITTVYFGGGTPSLLPPTLLGKVAEGLKKRLPIQADAEWTSEANPGTLTSAWLCAAREAGINRLSLGMQAAQNRLLQLMGRIHRAEDVVSAVEEARSEGFTNLSLDLMFGFPTQSRSEWRETLSFAFSFFPEHLSAYGLIPEDGTPLQADLRSGKLLLPEPEEERDMYEDLLAGAAGAGLKQYEISNFARPGFACMHNIGYWTQIPYLGLGLGASSMTRLHRSASGIRYFRAASVREMKSYLAGIAEGRPVWAEAGWIEPPEARFETMMLGLRMNRGVSETAFRRMHGQSLEDCYGEKLRNLALRNLVAYDDGSWRLTRLGMDLQNTVLVELMEDE